MAIVTGAPVLSNMGLERISWSGEESLAHMALSHRDASQTALSMTA
jgi:hypothetical protein